ncbi:hypothetical protein BpHYR1_026361 [Brachionus plicatilis]|uniref:Uncharacterized protein n=1 Tax=Brachionus plicatilis TaxID=10195 RepID=A0A3M7T2F2_BRAPC|nr:hypothetical protein BpHYR1_026361 [Brachionus plicatilis]
MLPREISTEIPKKIFNNRIIKENQQHIEYLNMNKGEVLDNEKNIKNRKAQSAGINSSIKKNIQAVYDQYG